MDLFDVAAKITLNTSEYEEGLKGAEGKGSSFASKLKSGLISAAKVGVVALGAAATGISTLIGNSIKEYADYEQLVGGVETLFKKSAPIVEAYAANAYKTAGLSANEYMETVTSFSASLLKSLGGDTLKAANYANMAITDMSDNANKMGSSMESVQAAYQGFAKQNYTMLDNLKLGYGGTQSEMIRLVEDAQRLDSSFKAHTETVTENKKEVEKLAPTYADIVQAIHIVQSEMGITGTTAKEASETISGSLASMKSAWKNLIVGIADENANFDELIDDFVKSASTAVGNILPRISQSLKGIGKLIEKLAPVIASAIPTLVSDVLPTLLRSATSLVSSLGNAILNNLPTIASTAMDIIMTLVRGLTEPGNIENFINSAFVIISQLVSSISQALPELIPAAVSMIMQLVESYYDNIDLLVDAAISLIMGFADGLLEAIPILIEKAPIIIQKLVSAIIRNAPKLFDAASELINKLAVGIAMLWEAVKSWGVNIINKIWEGIKSLWGDVVTWGRDIIDKVWDGLKGAISDAVTWGKDLIVNFWNGIKSKLDWLWSGVKSIGQGIADFLGFSEPKKGPLSDFHTYAPDMMELFMKGIRDNKKKLTDTVAEAFDFGGLMTVPGKQITAPAFGGSVGSMPFYGGEIKLYIDGDRLVGSTSEKMDRDLGDIQEIRARWEGRKK